MFSGSPKLTAINYALAQLAGRVRYLKDRRVEIDNHPAERPMRPIALHRKNGMLAGHELDAETWATIASFVET